ncbi:hypothetical protein AND_007111 [Anopheles darlingi]|uniref:Secreted protein n=1 Tax=Anopheles darlingi TaxID=43151 RepID=W5JEA6_ANODA|nr:hypothetical protein AND_007111 [Anopheles darlingi]
MEKFLVLFVCFVGLLAVASGSVEHPKIGRLGQFWERCQNNTESDGVLIGAYRSVRMGDHCVRRIEFEELWSDLQLITNETRKSFFEEYCPQLRMFNICLSAIVDNLKPCYKEIEYNVPRELASVVPAAVELLCKDDGEIFFRAIDYGHRMECLRDWDAKVKGCFTIFEEMQPVYSFLLTQEQCSMFTSFRQCLNEKNERAEEGCQISPVATIYDLFYNALFRSGGCRNA